MTTRRLQNLSKVKRTLPTIQDDITNAKKPWNIEDNNKPVDIEDLHRIHIKRIQQMRAAENAPVDTMGCHKLADPLAKPEVFRFQVLISLMLSSQTRDQTNAAAMARLREYGLSLESMLEIDCQKLQDLLIPVSFYKRKTEYIKKTAAILKEKYSGDIPDTVEGLCALPGVGPKMAHLVMQIAWNKVEGIAVDVHVNRICNRLGWMKTKTPEETRKALQEMLPKSEWNAINPLLVGFGQTICLPVNPNCEVCLCNDICPSSKIKKS